MHGRFRIQDTATWFVVPHFNPCEVILLFRECKQVEEENVKKQKKKAQKSTRHYIPTKGL